MLRPLVNDPTREATAAMRGFRYQILRSVQVWLDLRETELLVLEGAEDLDRIGHREATAEQVKDTVGSGAVTLGSANVRAAIMSFWRHKERNPEVSLCFRYLTTSKIGREKGSPFGPAQAGLKIWMEIRADPEAKSAETKAATIGRFLAAQEEHPESLRVFLRTAGPRSIIDGLIRPIEWLTAQSDCSAVVRQIEERLVAIGENRGLNVEDSKLVIGSLCEAAWKAATNTDRKPLRRADMLTVFDDATRISVPKREYASLISLTAGAHGWANYSAPGATPNLGGIDEEVARNGFTDGTEYAFGLLLGAEEANRKGDVSNSYATAKKLLKIVADGDSAPDVAMLIATRALLLALHSAAFLPNAVPKISALLLSDGLRSADRGYIRRDDIASIVLELASINQGFTNYETVDDLLELIGTKSDQAISTKLLPRMLMQRISKKKIITPAEIRAELGGVKGDAKSDIRRLLLCTFASMAADDWSRARGFAEEAVAEVLRDASLGSAHKFDPMLAAEAAIALSSTRIATKEPVDTSEVRNQLAAITDRRLRLKLRPSLMDLVSGFGSRDPAHVAPLVRVHGNLLYGTAVAAPLLVSVTRRFVDRLTQ